MYFSAMQKRDGGVAEFDAPNYPRRLCKTGEASGQADRNMRFAADI